MLPSYYSYPWILSKFVIWCHALCGSMRSLLCLSSDVILCTVVWDHFLCCWIHRFLSPASWWVLMPVLACLRRCLCWSMCIGACFGLYALVPVLVCGCWCLCWSVCVGACVGLCVLDPVLVCVRWCLCWSACVRPVIFYNILVRDLAVEKNLYNTVIMIRTANI